MSDTERVIGMLMEFKRSHEHRMDRFEKESASQFSMLNRKLDKLNWKVASVSSALSVALSLIIKFWK